MSRIRPFLLTVLSLVCVHSATAELFQFEHPRWEPIVDEVYLQAVASQIPTEAPLTAVAVYNDTPYAGGPGGLYQIGEKSLQPVAGVSGGVDALIVAGGDLWVLGAGTLQSYDGSTWTPIALDGVVDVCADGETVVAATSKALFELADGTATRLTEDTRANLLGVTAYSGTYYVHDGSRIGLMEDGKITFQYIADWGTLQRGSAIRDIMGDGSKLIVATDEGLGLLRGMTWYHIQGEDGLCVEDTTTLAEGFDRDLWIGTKRGAIRHVNDDYQYFGTGRWLPDMEVNAIASADKVVYIATNGGLGVVTYEPYTLAKKAAYYERWLNEWGMKRLGFVHTLFLIDGEWQREVSDNDVGYSSHYMTSKCFEYAVTGSETARTQALDMMKSVKWSEEITSIDGFPARSIYNVGEHTVKAMHGSGGLPAEWHRTPDGMWEWKGDTSSDETDAHMYETMLFLQLVANDEEKVWATEHMHRVFGHIVDNGFYLKDVDGEPTRWARWDPEYLQTPYGYYARGLNGMEAMNYMTTALYFTGDPKFAAGKQQLLDWNYQGDILRQKLTFHPGFFTHFDDRLAFYTYYSLVQYEQDPELKRLWLRSLERSWEVKRIQAVPWFNFIYGALTGNDCETDRAVSHLRDWPMDLRRHQYRNGHRDDLFTPPGYREYANRPVPLSPRETEPNRWDGDFMRLDGGYAGGTVVADPGGWLDAYWMGRYYGMITAPQTDDPALVLVPERGLQLGAKPYDGPPRPKLEHEMK